MALLDDCSDDIIQMQIANAIPFVEARLHLRTIERDIIQDLTFFLVTIKSVLFYKIYPGNPQGAFFVAHALYNDGIVEGDCTINQVWFAIAKEEGNTL